MAYCRVYDSACHQYIHMHR